MNRATEDLLFGAAVIGGAYLLLKHFLGPAANAVTKPVAQAWVWATSPAATSVSGYVVLPNGQRVAWNDIPTTAFDQSANVLTFTYQGTRYKIVANPSGGPSYDTNGDYHAVKVA